MSKFFDFKLIFVVIFLLLTIAIQNCENFQFKKDVSDNNEKSIVKASKTKIRFPFRKLEKIDINEEDDDDSDTDPEDDDDDEKVDLKSFAKVRRQKFEVKKRPELRFSKLAQFREDDDSNENDEEDEESQSFFSRVLNYFKSKPKEESENESDSKESDDDDQDGSAERDSDDDEVDQEEKPLLVEMFDKFKAFLEARNQNQDRSSQLSSSDEDLDDDNDAEQSGQEADEKSNHLVEIESESTLKNAIKNTFNEIFNRKPFNLIFDFDDDDESDSVDTYDDSEEDELNYQKLLKEEREQEKLKTEHLIKQDLQEETSKIDESAEEQALPKNGLARKEPKPKKSKEELHLAQIQFEKLLLNLPSFVPDYSKVKNPECQKQGEVFQRQLRGQKLWALQMMDANAKIPSGLLRGNINQLGDFDLCTKIAQKIKITESTTIKMKGKYCLANIDVVAAVDQLKLPVHLMQGRNFIRSTINDPNHFFPRYSTINWGLCLPSACTYNDADNILESFIGPYNSTGIKLHISVDEDSCYMRKSAENLNLIKSDWKIFGTCLVIFLVVSATVLSTLNEYLDSPLVSAILNSKANQKQTSDESQEEKIDNKIFKSNDSLPNKILSSFSLKRNLSYLWSVSNEEEEIKCLHGLKAISIILLFISLKLIEIGRVPYTNRNKFTEFFNSPLSVFLRSSFLYEDVFLIISGLLASISTIRDISSGGKIVWLKKLFGRFLRLALPLAIVLLFYAFVFEHLSTGPQWNIVTKNAELCQENLWKNLLFIQNFYSFEDMCASHTYHLAIDFQLFILTPLLVWLIYKNPTYGFGIYGILHTLSTAARFSSTIESRLSTVVFHGMKLSQLYRTFDLSFSVALHRATPYLIGLALGIVIKEFGKVKLAVGVKVSGWLATFACIIWCFYKPSNLSHKDYQYDPTAAAQYSALAPILWALSISWIIFSCYSDENLKLNSILSSRFMIFISRISFSIYLLIFIVFFYFSGTLKSSEEFHVLSYLDRVETCIVLIIATLFTLVVDVPTQNIVKLILGSSSSSNDSNHNNGKASIEEEEIEDIFANNDDDFMYKPLKPKFSSREYDENVNGNHVNGKDEDEEEEEEEEESVVEAKIEIKPKAMNARRWKWEVTDD